MPIRVAYNTLTTNKNSPISTRIAEFVKPLKKIIFVVTTTCQ